MQRHVEQQVRLVEASFTSRFSSSAAPCFSIS